MDRRAVASPGPRAQHLQETLRKGCIMGYAAVSSVRSHIDSGRETCSLHCILGGRGVSMSNAGLIIIIMMIMTVHFIYRALFKVLIRHLKKDPLV